MSCINSEAENALKQVQNEIENAIKINDAKAVDFYHKFVQIIECKEMLKQMKSLNVVGLRNIINYQEEKLNFLIGQLATVDDFSYLLNDI